MRILMTADAVGGVWSYALELASALRPDDVEIVLATMGRRPSDAQRAEAARLRNVWLVESDFRLEWQEDPWADVDRAGEWLLALAASRRPDIVHLNGYAHGALAWGAPVVIVAHSDVLSWWEAVHRVPAPASWRRYQERVRAGLQGADLVVAPTYAMLAALERQYGPARRARVIANARAQADWRPDEKHPYVLSIGRLWDEAKNIAALARIAPDLGWSVRIAGDVRGPDGRAAHLPGVTHLGTLDRAAVAAQLAHASIYCLPARYEPFGLSVLEAAHAGCALVLGDIPSLRELWDGAAVFVPPDDENALLGALGTLIEDPARRVRLAAIARARARHFTPERQAAAYLAAYDSLLGDATHRSDQRLARARSARREARASVGGDPGGVEPEHQGGDVEAGSCVS